MKEKQNINDLNENEIDEDSLDFFYKKYKERFYQTGGEVNAGAIAGGVAIGVFIIILLIIRRYINKPEEVREAALYQTELDANAKNFKNDPTDKDIFALQLTSLPPPDKKLKKTKTFNPEKVEIELEKAVEKKEAEEEAEKKANEEAEKKEEAEEKKAEAEEAEEPEEPEEEAEEAEEPEKAEEPEAEENQKGGNNENPADKLKNEIITKICKNTTEWKSNDEYKEIIKYRDGSDHQFWAPKIENRKLREVVEYNLLEGPVMNVIYKNISDKAMSSNPLQENYESKSQQDNEKMKKKIIDDIRDLVIKSFKKYKKCDFSQVQGDININSILTEEALTSIIGNTLEKIKNSIDSLNAEKIYDQLGIPPEAQNVCKSMPIATLMGIPRLTHKTLKGLEKALKKYKSTSEIIHDSENMLCVKLLDAIITDILDPMKKNMKKQINKIGNAFGLNTSNESMDGGALIGEGVYGCVFRPHLYCNGKESTGKKDHVSKLIIAKKWKIQREFYISKLIRKIPKYEKFFAPLLEICPVNLKNIYTQGKEDCKLLNKKQDSDKVSFIAKMKYINMIEFNDYISNTNNLNNFINFVSVFPNILNSIQMLIKKKIVHYDLHGGNIIINKDVNFPVIIDFGLSFTIKKFTVRDLNSIFGIFDNAPSWSNYPIEVHYLAFIVNNKRHMNIGEINNFVTKFLEKHRIINSFPGIINNSHKQNFKKKLILAMSLFKKDKINNCVKNIIKNCWKTWDTHMISYLFLNYFKIFNVNNLLLNKFNKKTISLLFKNISPLVEERLTPQKLSQYFLNCMSLLSPQILLEIKRNYDENQEFIHSSLKKETMISFNQRQTIENIF